MPGLAAVGGVMLPAELLAISVFFRMASFYAGDPVVQQAVLLLRALQIVALAFLTDVTVR